MRSAFFAMFMIPAVIADGKETLSIPGKGAQLFTTVYPKTGVETVILLHGGPGVPDDLTFVAQHLSQNFQVITFHQRGTAKSPVSKSDYSMESYIADIDSIAAHFGLERFHLFGHSWGGLYAQIYADKKPEKVLSLFLSSPSSGTGYQWKETEKEVMAFNKSKSSKREWLKIGWNSLKGMFGSSKAYRKVFAQVLVNYTRGFDFDGNGSINLENVKAAPINKTRKHLRKYPVLEAMKNPSFKITITYGEKDIYSESKKYLLERYSTAGIFTIENCGHLPALHNKEKFAGLLDAHYGRYPAGER